MRNSYIGQAWLVILLSLGFGGALAGVQVMLHQRIEENKLAETLSQIPALVPGAEEGKADTVAGQRLYRALAGGRHVGWVVPAGGQGFADRIELLIGLDADVRRITGLYVLEQKETPGLGNKIVEEKWRRQFSGKSASRPLVVVKGGAKGENEIDAVTGATISSESVCRIVNRTLSRMRDELTAEKR